MKPSAPFDFNHWAELARKDPEAFSRQRRMFIEAYIANKSHLDQARLKAFQFRIDMERRRTSVPLKACLRISAMMWDSFYEMIAVVDAAMGCDVARRQPSTGTARIIAFKKG